MGSKHNPARTQTIRFIALLFAGLCTACASEDSIDTSGEVFGEISENATIGLLGNEPFWSIEIQPDNEEGFMAVYKTPGNLDGSTASVARFAGNNGLGFTGDLDGEALQIAITPGECNDTMSDRTYPYTATVAVGDRTLYGCGYTDENMYQGGEAP